MTTEIPVVERFLRYIKIDTQSQPNSTTSPSTEKQFQLARLLVDELKELGMSNVTLSPHCYVMAELPANSSKNLPVIGFLAHLDTSPDMSGTNIKPQLHHNYQGDTIVLNAKEKIMLSPAEFPELLHYHTDTIITTDGTTLLGADDKAGIAEIMTALAYLKEHPEIEHGTVKVAFTPDEEIGSGVEHFDLEQFAADFAYTVDGGAVGELEYETFNAAMAKVTVQGRNVHPGYAKNKMKNALLIANELAALLPVEQRPEFTSGYEGFFHLLQLQGDVEKAEMTYIIRDHENTAFEAKKKLFKRIMTFLNEKHGSNTVRMAMHDQYYNMREKINPVFYIVELAQKAMKKNGIKPKIGPVRGGTDGAWLSFKGLPTPNIFAGGHNFHGKYEFIPVSSMQKAVDVIVSIISLNAE